MTVWPDHCRKFTSKPSAVNVAIPICTCTARLQTTGCYTAIIAFVVQTEMMLVIKMIILKFTIKKAAEKNAAAALKYAKNQLNNNGGELMERLFVAGEKMNAAIQGKCDINCVNAFRCTKDELTIACRPRIRILFTAHKNKC